VENIRFRANFFEVIAERFNLLETIKKYNLLSYLPISEIDFFIDKENYKITIMPSDNEIADLDDALEKFEDDCIDHTSLIDLLKKIDDPERARIKFSAKIFYKYLSNLYYELDVDEYNNELDDFIHHLFNSNILYFDVEMRYFFDTGHFMIKNHRKRRQITTECFDEDDFNDLLDSKYINKNINQKKVLKIIKNLNKSKFRKNFRHSILRKFVVLDNIPIFNPNFNYADSEEFYL